MNKTFKGIIAAECSNIIHNLSILRIFADISLKCFFLMVAMKNPKVSVGIRKSYTNPFGRVIGIILAQNICFSELF